MPYKTVVSSAIFMLILDYVWIKLVMGDLYLSYYRSILIVEDGNIVVRFSSALLVYLLMVAAVFYFAVLPSKNLSSKSTLIKGGFVGLYGYGMYDLTNHALIKIWSFKLSVLDVFWGAILCALTALFAKVIQEKIEV